MRRCVVVGQDRGGNVTRETCRVGKGTKSPWTVPESDLGNYVQPRIWQETRRARNHSRNSTDREAGLSNSAHSAFPSFLHPEGRISVFFFPLEFWEVLGLRESIVHDHVPQYSSYGGIPYSGHK